MSAESGSGAAGEEDADDGERSPEVTLSARAVEPFRRLSLFNSPYPAHDRGCAVDLYPDSNDGISPVAGRVLGTRTVRTPQRPYAAEHDHLVLVACDEAWCASAGAADVVARILHVDPAVERGDHVAVGDSLGELVRSGFFAPWVDNHVHLGLRTRGQHLHRASGSLPLCLPFDPTPLSWDGTGTVVETGETYVVLDAPAHPGAGAGWCGVAATGERGDRGVLDGGLPHYDGGGLFVGEGRDGVAGEGPVSFLGAVVGDRSGRAVTWRDVEVTVEDRPAVGLSLFLAAAGPAGAKVVCRNHGFERGDRVTVRVG
jgi:hypothetical protein